MNNPPTLDRKTFSDQVRDRMKQRPDPNSRVIDYVLDYANEIGLDEKNAGYLIDRDLKEKIEKEAIEHNFIKPVDRQS